MSERWVRTVTTPTKDYYRDAAVLADLADVDRVDPTNGQVLGWTGTAWEPVTPSSATGTVTTVSIVTANGVSGSVANPTTTPAITLTLGAITPTSIIASGTISGSNLSGTNTGDQTSVSGNAGTVTVADAGGDTTCWVLLGTSQTGNLSPATDAGLTYNATTDALTATTFIGALTGNASGSSGSCTGNAATATSLQTGRTINGTTFDGTSNITITAAAGTLTGNTLAAGVTISSLVQVGTITTGTWTGTTIAVANGGTGGTTAQTARVNLGVWHTVYKTATTTKSDNNLANDADLLFAMDASGVYEIECLFRWNTNSNPDFKFGFSTPASMTKAAYQRGHTLPSATTEVMAQNDATTMESSVSLVGANSGMGTLRVRGHIENGANAGNVNFQWAQNTTDGANPTSLYIGSYIKWRKIS